MFFKEYVVRNTKEVQSVSIEMDCLLILMLIIHLVNGELNLTAVCRFKGLEELHSRLNGTKLTIVPKMKEDDICREIFGSWYFKQKGMKFEASSFGGLSSCLTCICGGKDSSFENSSTENINVYNTIVGNTIVENVFACFAKPTSKQRTNHCTKYFISKEYNVNDLPGRPISGYFIFSEEEGKFHYEALAEEPAVLVDGNVEKQYLDSRGNHQPADKKSEDPLCKLDIQKHLRICSIVMNTLHIAKEYRFNSSTDFVYSGCPLRKISFRTGFAISRTKGKIYQEFMIGCHVKNVPEFAYIYLSRAYESQKVFVYRRGTDEELYLDSLTADVRGIIDNV